MVSCFILYLAGFICLDLSSTTVILFSMEACFQEFEVSFVSFKCLNVMSSASNSTLLGYLNSTASYSAQAAYFFDPFSFALHPPSFVLTEKTLICYYDHLGLPRLSYSSAIYHRRHGSMITLRCGALLDRADLDLTVFGLRPALTIYKFFDTSVYLGGTIPGGFDILGKIM